MYVDNDTHRPTVVGDSLGRTLRHVVLALLRAERSRHLGVRGDEGRARHPTGVHTDWNPLSCTLYDVLRGSYWLLSKISFSKIS